ncbi:MAG: hypothetical protein QM599_01285 [Pseudoxanthomonas sp.]
MDRSVRDEAISYIEKVGTCTALLIGSVTIMRFADKVFPIAPWVAVVAGGLLFFLAFFLVVWVFVTTGASVLKGVKNRWLAFIAAAAALLCTVFFFIASAYAAIAAFAP